MRLNVLICRHTSAVLGSNLKFEDQRQMITAHWRPHPFFNDPDCRRDKAMIERDSSKWQPRGPRAEQPALSRDVFQPAIAKQIGEIWTPWRAIQVAKNNRCHASAADERGNFLKLFIPQPGVFCGTRRQRMGAQQKNRLPAHGNGRCNGWHFGLARFNHLAVRQRKTAKSPAKANEAAPIASSQRFIGD